MLLLLLMLLVIGSPARLFESSTYFPPFVPMLVSHRKSAPVPVSHSGSMPELMSVPVMSSGVDCSKRSFACATTTGPKDGPSASPSGADSIPVPVPVYNDGESSRRKFEEEENRFSSLVSSLGERVGMGVTRTIKRAYTSVIDGKKSEECIGIALDKGYQNSNGRWMMTTEKKIIRVTKFLFLLNQKKIVLGFCGAAILSFSFSAFFLVTHADGRRP